MPSLLAARRSGDGRDALERSRAGAGTDGETSPRLRSGRRWPKLPNNWVVGHVASVAVDSRDHVLMLHRPNTIPEAQRSQAAPPVLEFDADGEIRERVGRPRTRLRLAGQRTRHRRRLQEQRVDRRQRSGRTVAAQSRRRHAPEVRQQGKVPAADRRAGASARATPTRRPCTSRRTSSCGQRPTRRSSRTATATAA